MGTNKMKKLVSIIILTILMIGCQENDSILGPFNDPSNESLNKLTTLPSLNLGRDDEIIDVSKDLEPSNVKIMKILAKNYTFDGAVGGKIVQKYQWTSDTAKLMLEAYLTIPPGAYEGELTFEIVFDPNQLSMELHPTPFYFDKPVVLTMQYKGISENYIIDSEKLDFQYHNPDGSFEKVDYQKIDWDPIDRELKVFQAELHHFSRYGWVRKKDVDLKEKIPAVI